MELSVFGERVDEADSVDEVDGRVHGGPRSMQQLRHDIIVMC